MLSLMTALNKRRAASTGVRVRDGDDGDGSGAIVVGVTADATARPIATAWLTFIIRMRAAQKSQRVRACASSLDRDFYRYVSWSNPALTRHCSTDSLARSRQAAPRVARQTGRAQRTAPGAGRGG
jgi:hypothetical protein